MITPGTAIADPKLLGPYFAADSWARWRAVVKAACGESLTETERQLFIEVAEREPPTERVRELWAVVGRRGGKDSIASGIAVAAALGNYSDQLRPGERATVVCLASDRDQAKIIFRYIAGYFARIPLLSPMIVRETDDSLELRNGVEIVVATNSFRSVRGRSVVCAILDEVAFYPAVDTALPDVETYNALEPAMATFRNAILIGISSPYRRRGLLFDKWRKHYGQPSRDVLVVRGTSRQFNPSLSQSFVDSKLESDPEVAASEYLAEWRADLSDFISRAIIDACVETGCHERPYVSGVPRYFAFIDASGGTGSDSMTLGIAHADKDRGPVLDVLRERRPPFSPRDVVKEFSALLRSYRITQAQSDKWGGDWIGEAFRDHNIRVVPSAKPKSELYGEIIASLSAHQCSLLDNPRLISQLGGLERRTARGGRSSIDHAPGAHDDVANAAVGALLLAKTQHDLVISDDAMAVLSGQFGLREAGLMAVDDDVLAVLRR